MRLAWKIGVEESSRSRGGVEEVWRSTVEEVSKQDACVGISYSVVALGTDSGERKPDQAYPEESPDSEPRSLFDSGVSVREPACTAAASSLRVGRRQAARAVPVEQAECKPYFAISKQDACVGVSYSAELHSATAHTNSNTYSTVHYTYRLYVSFIRQFIGRRKWCLPFVLIRQEEESGSASSGFGANGSEFPAPLPAFPRDP